MEHTSHNIWNKNDNHFKPMKYVAHLHYPDIKVHGANMGPTWGRQDPGGPRVGPTNFAFWVTKGFCPQLFFQL